MFPNFALLFLLNVQQEVLLLRRINTPFCNHCYALPGGTIKTGETARECVIRETKNSLGITINPDILEFIHVMHRKCNDPEFFACVFQSPTQEEIPYNCQPEQYDNMQWFPLDKLPKNMVPAHRHALSQIQQQVVYSEHGW